MTGQGPKKSLQGRRLLVTRPEEVCARSVAAIEVMGGRGVAVPAVSIGPPDDLAALGAAVGRANDFDWILFTSTRSVPPFAEVLREPGKPRVGAVGPLTERRLGDLGLEVDVMPRDRYDGEGLFLAWRDAVQDPSCRVLLPRSDRALDHLPNRLREEGARVEEVEAYRTRPRAIRRGQLEQMESLDCILLASPSAVAGLFAEVTPEDLFGLMPGVVLAAIGPTTGKALEVAGTRAAVIPAVPTWEALLEATAAYLDQP